MPVRLAKADRRAEGVLIDSRTSPGIRGRDTRFPWNTSPGLRHSSRRWRDLRKATAPRAQVPSRTRLCAGHHSPRGYDQRQESIRGGGACSVQPILDNAGESDLCPATGRWAVHVHDTAKRGNDRILGICEEPPPTPFSPFGPRPRSSVRRTATLAARRRPCARMAPGRLLTPPPPPRSAPPPPRRPPAAPSPPAGSAAR